MFTTDGFTVQPLEFPGGDIGSLAVHRTLMDENAIPVHKVVASVCEMLGYDPLYLACEGRVVAVLAPDQAEAALTAWRALSAGRAAAIIGKVDKTRRFVVMETALGGERILDELKDDPLPRIC